MKNTSTFKIVVMIAATIIMTFGMAHAGSPPNSGETSGYVETNPHFDWGTGWNGGSSTGMVWGSYHITDNTTGIVEGNAFVSGFAYGERGMGETRTVGDKDFTENWSSGVFSLLGRVERVEGEQGTLNLGVRGSLMNTSSISPAGESSTTNATHTTSLDGLNWSTTGEVLEGSLTVFGMTSAMKHDDDISQTRQANFMTGLTASTPMTGLVNGEVNTLAEKGGVCGANSYSTTNTTVTMGINTGEIISGWGYSNAFSERTPDGSYGSAHAASGVTVE